jgi:hypothetical protein
MSSIWLPLALAETTILLHEILNLGKWRRLFNWGAATAIALTTILSSGLMIAAMGEWKYALVATRCDFFVTTCHLVATFFIVVPLLGLPTTKPTLIKRLLWFLKVSFPVSKTTSDVPC